MKSSFAKAILLSLISAVGVSIAGAQTTVTVGPTGTYATPCAAFPHLADGDTVQVDANGGVPYTTDEHDCSINNNNLTIVGVNGRPIIDAEGNNIYSAIWLVNGHDVVIDNFEFRNSQGGQGGNAEAIRVQAGDNTPDGGNVTVQRSYIHDCGTGILSDAIKPGGTYSYYSANPYITFQYDEFYHNGNNGNGQTHNIYIGYGGNLTFNMDYSWSHDMNPNPGSGHLLKDRAPFSNVYYNLFSDQLGASDYLLDWGDGGSVYAVANSIYKTAVSACCNKNFMIYRNAQDTDGQAEYTNEDFHFVNNTLVDDPANAGGSVTQVISMECFGETNSDDCPLPENGGPALTTPAVLENNIVLGPPGLALTNQSEAYTSNNIFETNTAANLSSMKFNNAAALDYRLTPGSPAIGAGIYPPTNNTGTADPAALAQDEYSIPMNGKAWPTPSGSHMDAGAFYYAGAITPPSLTLNYTNSVAVPGTGTITVSGLPTPPSGQYNYAAFASQNTAVIPTPLTVASSTSTITATFTTLPEMATTVVPINIYVDGTVLTANVTVNPGPPTVNSIALNDGKYYPSTTVTLNGPAAAGGTVVDLSSSDSTYWYAPASVTVPAGQLSVSGGTLDGSLWAPALSSKGPVTLTATTGSTQATLTALVWSPVIHAWACNSSCAVTGGQPYNAVLQMAGISPVGGSTVYFTSNNTAVIPNQSYFWPQGDYGSFSPPADYVPLTTNSVATATNVIVTANYDGSNCCSITVTVNPGSGSVGAPSGLTAGSPSSNRVPLSWSASPTPGVTYSVFRSTTSGFTPSSGNQIASGLGTLTYTDATAATATTYYYLVEAVEAGTSSSPSNQASATTLAIGTDVIDINADGPAESPYVADKDYSGGSYGGNTSHTIDTSHVVDPAPMAVYQTARSGTFSYIIPGLTVGDTYTVRLHFSSNYETKVGQREFNVAINSTPVLTNFDIFAAAGGQYIGVAEDFTATANSSGQIVIAFTYGAVGSPLVNGVQIQQ